MFLTFDEELEVYIGKMPPMTVTSQLQCIHRSTLPNRRYVTRHEVILTDVQPCPR